MNGVSATKYSASMDDELLAAVRAEAETEGATLSGWLAEAACDRLRLKALRALVNDWEAEHGAISIAELDALEQKLDTARRRASGRAAGSNRSPVL